MNADIDYDANIPRMTVLIVDDQPENLMVLSEMLQPHYRVCATRSGEQALQAAIKEPKPDLILLDIMMPEMDGYTVLTRLQENPATRDILVIFVTALDTEEDEQRGLDLGAVDYISKPIRQSILLARVRTHLTLKRRTERLVNIGQAISGMAHCVKNILNGINAGSYLLENQMSADMFEKIDSGWRTMKKNLRLLNDVVLNMLAYSKDREPALVPYNIKDLCSDVVAMMEEQATLRQIELIFESEVQAPKIVLIDDSAIRRCLINLIGNALDACAEKKGARVVLTVGGEPSLGAGGFFLRIADNGGGMSKEVLAQLFTPFFSTKGNRGTGLGLTVTQKLIQEHGGSITASSTPGAGTTFLLKFPPSSTGITH
ncbi:putative Histidine kinase [Gammaproteobacteria bacterium]